MIKAVSSFSLLVALALSSTQPGLAQSGNWEIKTGFGDEITIKNGIFGNKKTVVKDRLGNKYERKKGIFGNTDTEVGVLGNTISKKKGLFGTRETEMKSILGDSVKMKKGWFGRRTTTIDASGVTSLLGSAIKSATKKADPPISLPAPDGHDLGMQGSFPSNLERYPLGQFPIPDSANPDLPLNQEGNQM